MEFLGESASSYNDLHSVTQSSDTKKTPATQPWLRLSSLAHLLNGGVLLRHVLRLLLKPPLARAARF